MSIAAKVRTRKAVMRMNTWRVVKAKSLQTKSINFSMKAA